MASATALPIAAGVGARGERSAGGGARGAASGAGVGEDRARCLAASGWYGGSGVEWGDGAGRGAGDALTLPSPRGRGGGDRGGVGV